MVTDTTIKKGYKQTEIGVIPEDWNVVRLNLLSNDIGDGIHSTPKYVDSSNYFFVNGNNLSDGRILITRDTKCISEDEYESLKKNLDNTTILMSINGTIGNLAFFNNETVVLGKSAAYIKLSQRIDKIFIYYLLQHSSIKKFYDNELTGTTIKNLSLASIRSTPIPIPPTKPEQTAIATVLSDTDALIEHLERLIAKKIAIKQGAMQQLLTGKKRLPGFSGEWKEKKLRDIADFLKGRGLSKSKLLYNGSYSCILYGELYTTYSRIIKEVKNKTNSREGLLSINGDILMPGSTTTVGIDLATASALQQNNVLLGGDLIVIRKKEPNNYNSEFLANYLTHISKYKIAEIAQGITIIHLHGSRLQEIFVKIPSDINEQVAIASVLSDMDAEIESLEQKRDKYIMLKQGMMHQLLTGRIRIYANN